MEKEFFIIVKISMLRVLGIMGKFMEMPILSVRNIVMKGSFVRGLRKGLGF